jgi:hypothetical protein
MKTLKTGSITVSVIFKITLSNDINYTGLNITFGMFILRRESCMQKEGAYPKPDLYRMLQYRINYSNCNFTPCIAILIIRFPHRDLDDWRL